MRHRLARLFAAALLLVAGSYAPRFVQPVAAADCSANYCAWLEIVPGNGAGSGFVSTNPYGIECEWSGSRSGTCLYQFSWSHGDTDGIDVDLYLDPGPHSYVCYGQTCAGLEVRLVRTVHLDPGNDIDVFPVFNLANKTTVTLRTAGTGAGRVTTNPTGLNCRVVAGVKSGTCSYDYWYLGNVYSVTLHRTPDAGNYACGGSAPSCGNPDTDYGSSLSMSPGASAPPVDFWPAIPVTVNLSGSGTVVSTPAGISCPPTCSKWFPPDGPLHFTKLSASPAAGWYIKDWTGAVCGSTTAASCTFANGYAGATVGVVFARLATPAPVVTPKPPATPKPTSKATPNPTSNPTTTTPSVAPTITGAPVPGSSGLATEAAPTALTSPDAQTSATAPDGSQVAVIPSGATAGPLGALTTTPLPGGSATEGSIDPTVLILLLIIAILTVALGYALGTRRRRAR